MKTEGKYKIGAVAITAMMCLMAFGAIIATVPQNAQAAYWFEPDNYGQRQAYTVVNADATDYTNVTINVYLTEANNPHIFDNCLSTGLDIIFTNFGSTTRMEHYMAYWDYPDHDALFQVVVPSLPASTTTHIWIYYGYAAATNLSDGDAVFTLFDDFSYSTYTNVTTESFDGSTPGAGAALWEKYPTATYVPDKTIFNTTAGKIRGITNAYNDTEGQIVAYGSYMNTSYNSILGMNNTDGYGTDWTLFNNVLVNHSATGASPDFIKASEPDFMHLISDSWRRSVVKDHGTALKNYTLFYTGLNATNYSICMASSPIFDAVWTKNESNPVLRNGTIPNFDSGGVRKPVVWKDGENDFRMIFSALNSTTSEWKLGYATAGAGQNTWTKPYTWSIFNGSDFGWDNGTDIKPLDIYHDGTNYVLLYSANDWEGVYRQGIATTLDFISWSRVGGYLGIGDTTDWDGYNATYATWMSTDNIKWSVYYTGQNSTANVSMGYADVVNTTIADWSSWQRDGGGSSMAFLNAENQLEIQWNTTMIERAVNIGNYSVTVDSWSSAGVHNESLFMRSDGGAYGTSEDYYAMAVNGNNGLMDTLEWTGGTSAVLNQTAFTYTGTEQHMYNLKIYGDYIHSYIEGMDSNETATGISVDATIDSGETGIRVDSQPKVKFDNFRAVSTSNGTISLGVGTAEDWIAETQYSGGDDVPVTDTDGDGMPDAWENAYFGDLDQNAETDFDGDGFTDYQEYLDGTDPTDPNDFGSEDIAEDMFEWFEDICGTFWWIIAIGILIMLFGLSGSSFFTGFLNTNQAIALGGVIIASAYSLNDGAVNVPVLAGSGLIIVDYVFNVPIPYLAKPIVSFIGALLIVIGFIGVM